MAAWITGSPPGEESEALMEVFGCLVMIVIIQYTIYKYLNNTVVCIWVVDNQEISSETSNGYTIYEDQNNTIVCMWIMHSQEISSEISNDSGNLVPGENAKNAIKGEKTEESRPSRNIKTIDWW